MENNINWKEFEGMRVKDVIWELIGIRAWLRYLAGLRKAAERGQKGDKRNPTPVVGIETQDARDE